MARLTVFTPAYNRAHTLPRTFASLCAQDCQDFEWLIVDDGSTDNTAELVKGWIREDHGFAIRYIHKENGGMHTAHNTAYEHINTELNVCIDSDDMLAEGAVRRILEKWDQVKHRGYAGLIGLDSDLEGKVIGSGFPEGMEETTLTGYYAAGGSGDKKLVYRTDVIRSVPPYPVFEGEKYVSLSYKYVLLDQEVKLAVIDAVLCRVEYQPDGSSATMWKQYRNNAKGFAFFRKTCMMCRTSIKLRFQDCVHYVSSCIFAKDSQWLTKSPYKLMTVIAVPFGIMLNALVRFKCWEMERKWNNR